MSASGDSKNLAKSTLVRGVAKKVTRTRELVLQNLGKVDKTRDDVFDELVEKFGHQQNQAVKVQKYLTHYVTSVRAAAVAADALHDILREVYEDDWAGKDDFDAHLAGVKANRNDYLRELDLASTALMAYQAQFPDVRAKIERRNRKMVDYDYTRHTCEEMQAKRNSDSKITKAEEKNADARRLYEALNEELLDLLPALYESRIVSFGSTFQSLFGAEAHFHGELSRLHAGLSDVIDVLFGDRDVLQRHPLGYAASRRHSNLTSSGPVYAAITRGVPGSGSARCSASSSVRVNAGGAVSNDSALQSTGSHTGSLVSTDQYPRHFAASHPVLSGSHDSLEVSRSSGGGGDDQEIEPVRQLQRVLPLMARSDVALENGDDDDDDFDLDPGEASPPQPRPIAAAAAINLNVAAHQPVNGASDPQLAPRVLYRVLTTHPYSREDDDELTFDADVVIRVLPSNDEEMDEGWLFGCLDVNPSVSGLFPANFTRRI